MDQYKFILEKPSGDMITHSVKAKTEDEAYDKISAKNLGRVREVKRTTNVYGYKAKFTGCNVYDISIRIDAEFEGENYDIKCTFDLGMGEVIDMTTENGMDPIPDILHQRIKDEILNAQFSYELKIQ